MKTVVMAADPSYCEKVSKDSSKEVSFSFSAAAAAAVADPTKMVKISTNDGEKFLIPQTVIVHSKFLSSMTEDGTDEEIPLPDITGPIFRKVLEFINHQIEVPDDKLHKFTAPFEPEDESMAKYGLASWYEDWISGKHLFEGDAEAEKLRCWNVCELCQAGIYLDIESLVHISQAKIAFDLRKTSADDKRRIFGIVDDFTPEEKKILEDKRFWEAIKA